MKFKIIEMDMSEGTIVLDWGWCTLNHKIPYPILENPEMDMDEVRKFLATLEPERPSITAQNKSLMRLAELDSADVYTLEEERFNKRSHSNPPEEANEPSDVPDVTSDVFDEYDREIREKPKIF